MVSKYFIGYLEGGIAKPLCIILPQMSGYIKYFKNGSKNMSFLIKDSELREKYDKIWDEIKNKLRIDKENHLQVYLEKCKYRTKKIQMCRFINNELKSDSDSDWSDLDSEKIGAKVDNKLMTKLESGSDSE